MKRKDEISAPARCEHHFCRCMRAAELAAMGMTMEAMRVHGEKVRCWKAAREARGSGEGMITLFDIAKGRGVAVGSDGVTAASEFERVGVTMIGNCQRCGAMLSSYDAYPGYNGSFYCRGCAESALVFESVSEFESWRPVFVSLIQPRGFRAMVFNYVKTDRERLFVIDDNGVQHELPTIYEVCNVCEGNGRVATPAPELEDGSYDFSEVYRSGRADSVCPKCNGLRVMVVVDGGRCAPELLRIYNRLARQQASPGAQPDTPPARRFLHGTETQIGGVAKREGGER